MRQTRKIAANELRFLFYSPVAWLLLVVFLFQVNAWYADIFRGLLERQALAGAAEYGLTEALLTGLFGLYTRVQQHLYLYVPLLTMGLVSREKSSGSIKLLYSSPVTPARVIAGKYLSILAYGAVMILALALPVLFSARVIPAFDLPLALSGLLGLYLLLAAYAAIGLYMSTLTSYQIVAAAGTLAALFFLNFIGDVGQGIPLVRDITYWLSIKGRATVLVDGLLCSEEIAYFLLVILLFLALAVMKIDNGTRRGAIAATLRHLAVILPVLLAGYVTSRPSLLLYLDLTATRSRTLAPESRRIMDSLEGDLTITACVNILGENYTHGLPRAVNRHVQLFKPYIRFKPDIRLDQLYYYHKVLPFDAPRFAGMTDKELAAALLNNAGARVRPLPSLEELDPRGRVDPRRLADEGHGFFWNVEHRGARASIRLFQDMILYPSEREISAAMKRLVTPPARVLFVAGHGERDPAGAGDRDYQAFVSRRSFRHSLVNQGFDARAARLDTLAAAALDATGILVITAGQTPFTPGEIERVHRFVARGGNLLVLGEPGAGRFLNPLVAPLGLRFREEALSQPREGFDAALLAGEITGAAALLLPGLAGVREKDERVTLPGAVALERAGERGFRVHPLLSAPGDTTASRVTALALARRAGAGEQRVIVAGDADCFSNAELMITREGIRSGNFTFLVEAFRWLSGDEFPVDTRRPAPRDTSLSLPFSAMKWVRLVFCWLLPLSIVAGFLLARWRRRAG
ncbi:MAG: Gldg family protein [Odoribacteraceae bacterium]|jgi:ABC-2 type transport system permease protein|nr:Gldg family protein [Odoribacteraceae bacterium]